MSEALSSNPRNECPHGSLRRQCEICERDETIERLQRENDRLSRNVIGAYEAGWLTAANWMERDDLGADIGSPAYCADRDKALAALPAVETTPSKVPPREFDIESHQGLYTPDPLASKDHDLTIRETDVQPSTIEPPTGADETAAGRWPLGNPAWCEAGRHTFLPAGGEYCIRCGIKDER